MRKSRTSLRCAKAPSPTSSSVENPDVDTRCSNVAPSANRQPKNGVRALGVKSFATEAPITLLPQFTDQAPSAARDGTESASVVSSAKFASSTSFPEYPVTDTRQLLGNAYDARPWKSRKWYGSTCVVNAVTTASA